MQRTALTEAATVQGALRDAQKARRQVEENLRLTAERLALAVRIAGVSNATITYGEDGSSVVDVSPELGVFLGLPPGVHAVEDLSSLIHPDDRDDVAARFAAATDPGGAGLFNSEHRIVRFDGTVAWINVRSTTFFQADGQGRRPRLTVIAVRDISARKHVDETLRASEARYRTALLVGRIASWETNLATRERFWSPEGKILFGLAIPDLVGRVGGPDDEYRNALHPDDRYLMEHFHRLAEGHDGFAAEYRILHADGTLLWVTGRGQVIERSASGKPIRLLSVVADITERKLAEVAVRASEARFRLLAEAIPNIAWTTNSSGILDWHSPRWTEYTGIAPQFLPDQNWQAPIHPDDLARTSTAWQTAVAKKQTYEIEHRMRGKDGVYRWFLSRAMPVTDANDRIVAWVGTATNIHALKTTEESLARYVTVANAAHDGLISITPEGVIENWNHGAERIFAYRSEEVVGRPTAMLIPDDAFAAHQDMITAVKRGGTVGPIDVKRRHKDGRLIDVAISMTAVKDDSGELIAIAKVVHDISERLEAERRQKLLNQELAHRVKNSFAVLLSVMRATLRSAPDLQAFGDAFTGRMQSMAAAQDLLTDSEWRGAELTYLAERQLAPHVAAGRIEITGPQVGLPAEFAVPLGLLLHELGTNAVKYGALSVPGGRVSVSWSLQAGGAGPEVKIVWREHDGPPIVEPKRRGFGSVLIEKSLASAKIHREFRPDGVICTIIIPLHKRTAPSDVSDNGDEVLAAIVGD